MDVIAGFLDLIQKYGLGIVTTVAVTAGLVYLFRLYQASWAARLKQEADRADYIEKLRAEERAGRLDAEVRLASNATALRDATAAFASAQSLMEKLVERDTPRRRTGG